MKKVFLQRFAQIVAIGLFLVLPAAAKVSAQTAGGGNIGGQCAIDSDCGTGQKCDPVAFKCVSPDVGGGSNGGTVSNGGDCGDPNLVKINGVCLPQKQCTPGSITCVDSLSDLLLLIIKDLLFFAGIVAVLFVIIGGFWYITAQGNEEQAEKGKNTLVNAIIGVIVVTMAYVIVSVVANTLNSGNAVGTNNQATTGAPASGGQTPGVDNSSGGSRGPIVF